MKQKSVKKESLSSAYHHLVSLCKDTRYDQKHLMADGNTLWDTSEDILAAINKFHNDLASISLMSGILQWAQSVSQNRAFGEKYLTMFAELLEEKLFPPKKNITIKEFAQIDHFSTIDRIRSHAKWFLQKREVFVSIYIEFGNWLAQITYGLVPPAIDSDREITTRRKVPFEVYIELLTLLPEREKILAKLFYLGGERSLEEVLSIEIKHIDFSFGKITFPDHDVRYPMHLINDLQEYIGGRKKGFVFINKNGERINHTVPYRALKAAAEQLNLPAAFTFKDLVKEH